MRTSFCVILAAMMISCGTSSARKNEAVSAEKSTSTASVAKADNTPRKLQYEVVGSWSHPTTHYTQGLLWHDGKLYESIGQYGQSALHVMTLDGRSERRVELDGQYFGEGVTLFDGKLYQLTWLERTGFVYDAQSLSPVARWEYSGEGWGITSDSTKMYMSDGTHVLRVLDPATLKVTERIYVRFGNRYLRDLNELEWIDGRIWANLYGYNRIVIINPATGQVESYIDFDELVLTQRANPRRDVFNGIAWDPASGRIFVTGKNWDKLFEIKIKNDE